LSTDTELPEKSKAIPERLLFLSFDKENKRGKGVPKISPEPRALLLTILGFKELREPLLKGRCKGIHGVYNYSSECLNEGAGLGPRLPPESCAKRPKYCQ
jgi:hypothetical protein